jgi:nucleoside-diphosphate-sugar epimerase
MKKVLVTGGTGFIGSHLCDYLSKKNLFVYCLDLKKKKEESWIKKNTKKIRIIYLDILNKRKLEDIVSKISCIFHLAAEISIPLSYKNPKKFIKTNILGTYNLLELAKKFNKEIIVTSTSETYGSGIQFPMTEEHRLHAQSPYAASKIAADQMALSFFNSYNCKVKIIRPFNCFGPRQSTRAIIPNMIIQMLKNKKNIEVGNINTERDFTFIDDLCQAYYILYRKNFYGKIFNIGSGKSIKIFDIFKKLKQIIKYKNDLKIDNSRLRPKKSEVSKLLACNKNIKKISSWKPGDFDKNLIKTVEWYKKNSSLFDEKKYNI